LPSDAGELDEVAAALAAQVWKGRTGQGHRAEQVGVELALDLLVRGFLGRADQRVPSVRNDDVDPVAATRSPRASSCSVRARPKPVEVPVMNQVLDAIGPLLS
jgi:hypothetical protein